LTDYAAELCRRWKAKNSAAYLLTGSEDHFIEPRCLQYRMKQYTKACGLENVHFHTLRHTFATRCVEVDFEIKSLSEILGHPSPTVTLERYVHSSMELKRSNMNMIVSLD
jgi:integrase